MVDVLDPQHRRKIFTKKNINLTHDIIHLLNCLNF